MEKKDIIKNEKLIDNRNLPQNTKIFIILYLLEITSIKMFLKIIAQVIKYHKNCSKLIYKKLIRLSVLGFSINDANIKFVKIG